MSVFNFLVHFSKINKTNSLFYFLKDNKYTKDTFHFTYIFLLANLTKTLNFLVLIKQILMNKFTNLYKFIPCKVYIYNY